MLTLFDINSDNEIEKKRKKNKWRSIVEGWKGNEGTAKRENEGRE